MEGTNANKLALMRSIVLQANRIKTNVVENGNDIYRNEKETFDCFVENATERRFYRSCRHLMRNNGSCELVWNSYSDKRLKKTFRISKNTFNFILSCICHELERKTLNEDPEYISPECRFCVFYIIWEELIIIIPYLKWSVWVSTWNCFLDMPVNSWKFLARICYETYATKCSGV